MRYCYKISVMALLLFCCVLSSACTEEESRFLDSDQEIIRTEDRYQSQNVSIEIQSQRVNGSDVYIADIYLRSVESLQRVFAGEKWGKTTGKLKTMAAENDAILAVTGDSGHYFTVGWVIGNGEILRDTKNRKRDICIIYRNGELKTLHANQIDEEIMHAEAENIWQCFLFGPALLDENGHAYSEFDSNVSDSEI